MLATPSLQPLPSLTSTSLEAMALEVAGECQTYNGRITSFVILSCAVAATGGLLYGYDVGISGGVTSMDPFLEKFFPDVYADMKDSRTSNYCMFDSQLLTAFTSSLYVAGLFASLCASKVTQAFGRRASMLLGGAAFIVGAALGSLAVNVFMLILGRVLLGVGVGFTNQAYFTGSSAPLYLSEMAPPEHRGAINNGFDFFVGLGILSANLINYGTQKIHSDLGWRISIGLAIIPATIFAFGTLFLPETPSSMIQRTNSLQKATEMLRKIRGTDDVHAELDDIIAAGNVSKAARRPLLIIIQRKYRPHLVIAILIPFFKQMTGITAITFYSPLIFRTVGLGESSSLLSTVITGVINVGSVVVAVIIVDRLGRRKLFIVGGGLMFVTHLMVGGVLAAQLGDHGGTSKGYAYMILVLICVFNAGFASSWGPLGWLVPSEILPLEIRSVGQSMGIAVALLLASIVGQTLLAMLCHLKSGVFFFFGGWVLIMTVFVILLLPETKGLPIEKMDQIWREHWFWKKLEGAEKEGSAPSAVGE
ncbi:hexose carrier protein [Musa troglodytarum]|uniref:Hexose carrier protein n=1 Tax=Musa troglodytarum TaxID=320322 RepID=A0A9E7FIT5_9LILI|nr:hexose carrier protein [Musa troglodytarum]